MRGTERGGERGAETATGEGTGAGTEEGDTEAGLRHTLHVYSHHGMSSIRDVLYNHYFRLFFHNVQ